MWRKILLMFILFFLFNTKDSYHFKNTNKTQIFHIKNNDTDIKIIRFLDIDSNYHYYYINLKADSSGFYVKKLKIKLN